MIVKPMLTTIRNIPSVGGSSNVFGGNSSNGESLLKVLFRVKITQSKVIQIIIDKALSIAAIIENDDTINNQRIPICIQLLNHVKWCDNIQSPDDVLKMLLETVPVS